MRFPTDTIQGMPAISRREILRASAALPLFAITGRAAKTTDVAIESMDFSYEDYTYRVPIKFGGNVVDKVTLLNVNCVVKNKSGKTAKGFGSMPLGNVWSFPSKTMPYETTLNAMKQHATRMHQIIRGYKEFGHPVDHGVAWEPAFVKAATEVSAQLKLKEPIPHLCTLVTASPFDAAVHDAFGKLYGLSAFKTYGPDFMTHDLSRYLGPKFKGEYLERYVSKEPKARMPMYHLVGAVDPILDSDITKRVNDGLPETLPEWIRHNGLTNLKIKLNGDDIKWDVDRVVRVEKAASEVQKQRGVTKWVYSLDFNEKCPNVAYLLEFLKQVKEKVPAGYSRIQYVEQPTGRDLQANRANTMFEAAKLVPVVIDESLSEVEALYVAKGMGYSGAALKACKGQTQALLMGAAVQKEKMFVCVQDLTCPGASLIHSATLSAHVPGVAGIECNSRQYVPVANKDWVKRFPGIFVVKDGSMDTSVLNKPGLGAV
jgi:L-alanine-DL-glutamate epimerase-like enolase superfamily enzyme